MRKHTTAGGKDRKLHRDSTEQPAKEDMLLTVGKELVQKETGRLHPYLWYAVSCALLLLECGGLIAAVVSGWHMQVRSGWIFLAAVSACLVSAGFFRWERLEGKRRYGVFLFALVYITVLFLTRDTFQTGAGQFCNAAVSAVNRQYHSSVELFAVSGSEMTLTVFLIELTVLLAFLFGAVVVWRTDALVLGVLEFPILAVLFLFAGSPSILSLFALMFAALGVLAASRLFRRRLWGEAGSEQRRRNMECFENVQKKLLLLVTGVGLLLSILAFYLVRPGLSVQLEKAEHAASRLETGIVESLLGLLPQSGAGSILMTAETEGRGVQDGVLGDTDGYAVGTLEDLKITVTKAPEETVYLKGFIGSSYGNNRWQAPLEEHLKSAAVNWNIEDDPLLYVQNLPFLRTLYAAENSGMGAEGMAEMTVERLNASSAYTYVPYNTYLNEYYDIAGGDGAIMGQTEQEDIYSYYPVSECREALDTWNDGREDSGVLDRVEEAYRAYAQQWYLEVPDGLDDIQKLCEEQGFHQREEDWREEQGLLAGEQEKIEDFVITFLNENYTFDPEAEAVPEGEDFLKYFLEESKTGYSTHFATAAVILFRMCGVPARYVAGYAAPADIFTAQTDGTYTAVLQADNSHAWAEIYEPGVGWVPVETTPGALGLKQEVKTPEPDSGKSASEEAGEVEGGTGENVFERMMAALLDGSLGAMIHLMETAVMLLAVSSVLIHRTVRRREHLGRKTHEGTNANIVYIFRAFYELLLYAGMRQEVHSDAPSFCKTAAELCRGDGKNSGLTETEVQELYALALRAAYGQEECGSADVERARQIYRKAARVVKRSLRPGKRIRAVCWDGF